MDIAVEGPRSNHRKRIFINRRQDEMGIGLVLVHAIVQVVAQDHHFIARLQFLVIEERNFERTRDQTGQHHGKDGGDKRIGNRFHAAAGPRESWQTGGGLARRSDNSIAKVGAIAHVNRGHSFLILSWHP